MNAALFFVLMATGAVLYYGPFAAVVGRRQLVRTIHVYTGLALPLAFLVATAPRWGRRLRRDLGALNRFLPDDFRWLRSRRARAGEGVKASVRLGKFNPGQKVNAVFIGAAAVVMLATGSIMKWFGPFPVAWRTGATFVHDWFTLGIWLAIGGHVLLALSDPVALRGMTRGAVTASWAQHKRPRWYEEVAGETEARNEPSPEPAAR